MLINEKYARIKASAEKLYASGVDWGLFYRKVFGVKGIIRRACPTIEDLAEFEETPYATEIHRMLTELRKREPDAVKPGEAEKPTEPVKIMTLRIPQALHETLHDEAHEHRISMNKLCISKLMQFIDEDLVPSPEALRKPTEEEMAGEIEDPGAGL